LPAVFAFWSGAFRCATRHPRDVVPRLAGSAEQAGEEASEQPAVRVGGDVKRVIVASPRYLAAHPRIVEPADLTRHRIVTTTHFGHDAWIFPPPPGGTIARSVHFKPRLVSTAFAPRWRPP